MKLITVSGPPASGKTAVLLRALASLPPGQKTGVVKFDCLATYDRQQYVAAGYPAILGISGSLCPDHYFVTNIQDCFAWGKRRGLDYLISESAGLCNRCSPHIQGVTAVCVVDMLAGVDAPRKIGPMLRLADIIAVTKGDIVSQAEREVFAARLAAANPGARLLFVNGLTGQGAAALGKLFSQAPETETLRGGRLRFAMPTAICNFCYGDTLLAKGYRAGGTRPLIDDEAGRGKES